MSDELVVAKPNDIVVDSKYAGESSITELTSSNAFLPYIQLMGSSSNIVKQGKFPVGHFAMMKGKERIDLGASFDALILGWRPRAMEFGDDFISVYDPKNPEFQRIKNATGAGYAWGAEFLLYLQDFDEVACYLFGNASHRNEIPNVSAIYEKQKEQNEYILANFESYLIPPNKKGHSWHTVVVSESEASITKMIDVDKLKEIQTSFNNPAESEIETVEEDSRDM